MQLAVFMVWISW